MSNVRKSIVKFEEKYLPASFDCDDSYLNNYLLTESKLSHIKKDTFIYMYLLDNELAGFVALATSKVFAEIDKIERTYPAIVIGRLAVDMKHHRSGIASELLLYSLKKAQEVSDRVGCRLVFVEVRSDNEKAIELYKVKFKFKKMNRAIRKSKENPEISLTTFYMDFLEGIHWK